MTSHPVLKDLWIDLPGAFATLPRAPDRKDRLKALSSLSVAGLKPTCSWYPLFMQTKPKQGILSDYDYSSHLFLFLPLKETRKVREVAQRSQLVTCMPILLWCVPGHSQTHRRESYAWIAWILVLSWAFDAEVIIHFMACGQGFLWNPRWFVWRRIPVTIFFFLKQSQRFGFKILTFMVWVCDGDKGHILDQIFSTHRMG